MIHGRPPRGRRLPPRMGAREPEGVPAGIHLCGGGRMRSRRPEEESMILGSKRGSGPAAGLMRSWLASSWLVLFLVGCGPPLAVNPTHPLDSPRRGCSRFLRRRTFRWIARAERSAWRSPRRWTGPTPRCPPTTPNGSSFASATRPWCNVDCAGNPSRSGRELGIHPRRPRVDLHHLGAGAGSGTGMRFDANAVAWALRRVHAPDGDLPPELRWIDPESVIALDSRRFEHRPHGPGGGGRLRASLRPPRSGGGLLSRGPDHSLGYGGLMAAPGETEDVTILWRHDPDEPVHPGRGIRGRDVFRPPERPRDAPVRRTRSSACWSPWWRGPERIPAI